MIHWYRLVFLILLLFCFRPVWSQHRFTTGEILVSWKAASSPEQVLNRAGLLGEGWVAERKVSDMLNVWLLKNHENILEPEVFLNWLRGQPEVMTVQYNHYVNDRQLPPEPLPALQQIIPNDPKYLWQWHLNNDGFNGGIAGVDLGAPTAWDITTGGLSPAGDTVVVAVIDGGICPHCEDWGDNLWKNKDEIPDDGIDNDLNGYFDDYNGWNVNAQDDEILGYSTGHGTPVTGVLAAKGNNGIGVTGVMWNTKVMFVAGTSGSETTEAQILAAYDYVWKARKRYNDTNGAKGAYVVAVNCSFGIDYGFPSSSPLWCQAIEKLGEEGILTVAAAANGNWNIDEIGDIPSTCPQETLISVTTLTADDEKPGNAAWGPISVDLGAYGTDILTIKTGSPQYGVVSGTSFAAPEVTGAIGLLYTAPCSNLAALSQGNPEAAAIEVKKLILDNARANTSLANKVTTNGRLHLGDVLTAYQSACAECPVPYNIQLSAADTSSVTISWISAGNMESVDLRWRASGSTAWNTVTDVTTPHTLPDLSACTNYEFELLANCSASGSSNWTGLFQFMTDGCCKAPENFQTHTASTQATIHWDGVVAANSYNIRYRSAFPPTWKYISAIVSDSVLLPNLEPCSIVEWQIQSACDTGLTTYSASVFFETAGCGACYDQVYCVSKSNIATEEWISKVEIAGWEHSAEGFQGYQDFSGLADVPLLELYPNTQYFTTIHPEFLGIAYKEMFRVYVDFNLDGDFNDAGELVFDPGYAHDGPISGYLQTPYFSSLGITRMRVQMKFKAGSALNLPQPCEVFEFGQVEDYCVVLAESTTKSAMPESQHTMGIFPNPVSADWFTARLNGRSGTEEIALKVYDIAGNLRRSTILPMDGGQITVAGMDELPAGMYILEVETTQHNRFFGKFMRK